VYSLDTIIVITCKFAKLSHPSWLTQNLLISTPTPVSLHVLLNHTMLAYQTSDTYTPSAANEGLQRLCGVLVAYAN
jgi:hypothetical protein